MKFSGPCTRCRHHGSCQHQQDLSRATSPTGVAALALSRPYHITVVNARHGADAGRLEVSLECSLFEPHPKSPLNGFQ